MKPGDRAQDFKLASMQDREVGLSDFAGKKNVVLFFYTKDGRGGCKAEASKFRDAYKEFVVAGFAGRETFAIDQEGIVRYIFRSPSKTTQHVKESLEAIRRMRI